MKNLLFLSLSFFLLLSSCKKGENQSASEEADNMEINLDSIRMDSISKLEAIAFENAGVLPYVDLGNDLKLYLHQDGTLSFNNIDMDNGRFSKDNGAYLMYWGMGDVPSVLSVIVGDTYYPIYDNTEDLDSSFEFLSDYFMSNLYSEEQPFKDVVIYNPSDKSLSYKTNDGMGKIILSEIPTDNLRKVYWKPVAE